jgi:hypothetical protein
MQSARENVSSPVRVDDRSHLPQHFLGNVHVFTSFRFSADEMVARVDRFSLQILNCSSPIFRNRELVIARGEAYEVTVGQCW